jgi:exosortase family protein XrtF
LYEFSIVTLLKKISTQDKFIAKFILKAFCLYLIWFFIYDNWLLKDGWLDHFLINHLVDATSMILNFIGFDTFQYADAVGIDGTHGVLIGAPCNGLELFALFTGFIIIFPGKISNKLVYIPIGVLIIHFLNILRLVGLAVVVLYYPDSLDFNHKYTFTIIIYGIVFLMWMMWVKKFAKR